MGLGLGRIPWYELRSITGLLSSQVFGGQDTELIPTRILPAMQDITSILTCRYHNPAFSRPVLEEASNIHVALNHKFHTGTFRQVHSCIDPVYL